jgi:hypothetical protein
MLNRYAQIGDSVVATFFQTSTGVRSITLVNGLPLVPESTIGIRPGDRCRVKILGLTDDCQAYRVRERDFLAGSEGGRPYLLNLLTPSNDPAQNFTQDVLARTEELADGQRLAIIFELIELDTMLMRRLPVDEELKAHCRGNLDLSALVEAATPLIESIHIDSLRKRQAAYLRLAYYLSRAPEKRRLFQSVMREAVACNESWLPDKLFCDGFGDNSAMPWMRASRMMHDRVEKTRVCDDVTADDIRVMRAEALAKGGMMQAAKEILASIDPRKTKRTDPLKLLTNICLMLGEFEEAHNYLLQLVCIRTCAI